MKKHEIAATIIAAVVTTAANALMLRNALTSVKALKEHVRDSKEEVKEEAKEEA